MRHVLTLIWLTLAILGGCERAFAHAALVEAHPADGVVLEDTPTRARLRFNEPVSPLAFILTDAQGRTHRDLAVTSRNEVVEIGLPADLSRGSHILSFRVASGDGHPVSGSVVFSVGATTGTEVDPAIAGSSVVRPALWLARVALYLGLFVGVGGAFFMAWVAPALPVGKAGRVLGIVLAIGAAAAAISLGLHGLDALGMPLAAMGSFPPWATGWRTSLGPTVASAAAAFLFAWLSLRARAQGWRRASSLAALTGVGLSLALSGHASAAAPQWLMRPAVFLHAVGVAYWIGALVPLAITVPNAAAQALPAVRRFSYGALVAVAILTFAGLTLAVIQVEAPANLIGTAYGRILVAKIAVVAGLLCLAALNRLWLTPILAAPDRFGQKWLARSVVAEIVLSLVIFGLVGLWRFTPPPRALVAAAEAAASASVHLHTPNLMAQVTLSPGRPGATRAKIVLATGRAEPVTSKEVTLVLSKPDSGIEPLERRARRTAGEWQVDGLVMPLAGPWQVRVEILVNDFEKVSLEGTLTLKP